MGNYKTSCQKRWEQDPRFRHWIAEVKTNKFQAYCTCCKSHIALSNMWIQSLISHMKSERHSRMITAQNNSVDLRCYVKTSGSCSATAALTTKPNENSTAPSLSANSPVSSVLPPTKDDQEVQNQPLPSISYQSTSNPRGLDKFVIRDDVTKPEILWCLETVMTHKSLRTAEKDIKVLKKMCKDCPIISKMELGKDKIAYTIIYGIAPFYKDELQKSLNNSEFFSVGFDESFNKIAKRQQMDINARYWNIDSKEVETRYVTSAFLGRTRATDLLTSFLESIADLKKDKLLQISMDGPNVNWAFIDLLKKQLTGPKLLELGSCGLHTVHGAFKHAIVATGWEIVSYLRALWNIFKWYPVRKAQYMEYSGSTTFPLKFADIRWLENVDVAQRAIDIDGNLKKFVEGVKNDKGIAKCKSFQTIAAFSADPLLCPKLEFFKSLALEVEPFLREFQTDKPLVPFLHTALVSTISNIMERFMTNEAMNTITTLKAEDVQNKKNYLPLKKITLGFGTLKQLQTVKKDSKDLTDFQQNCRSAMIKFILKLLNRSPLIYPLTEAATCLDPGVIALD